MGNDEVTTSRTRLKTWSVLFLWFFAGLMGLAVLMLGALSNDWKIFAAGLALTEVCIVVLMTGKWLG